jgi:periplasmic mercuric ion binding protein
MFGMYSSAQSNDQSSINSAKTETIKVWGNCGMCKTRIEKAAKIEGVLKSEWDKESKILSVTYDPARTNIDSISKKVAAAGHDTEKYKADDKTYSSLPGCCQYERSK